MTAKLKNNFETYQPITHIKHPTNLNLQFPNTLLNDNID